MKKTIAIASANNSIANNISLFGSGNSANIFEFGNTQSGGTPSNTLKSIQVRLINSNDVTKIFAQEQTPVLNQSPDACQGDSGGPMTNITNSIAIGVISSDLVGNAQGTGGCGLGGRYMKISEYLPWIIETIHKESTPDYVCSNTVFKNLHILPDGITFDWSTSPSSMFSPVAAINASTFPVSRNGSSQGWGTVTLTAKLNGTTIATVNKTVWVGNPLSPITINTNGCFTLNNNMASLCRTFGYNMTSNTPLSNNPTLPIGQQAQTTANEYAYIGWPVANSYLNLSPTTPSLISIAKNQNSSFGTNNTGTYFMTVYANNGSCAISKNLQFTVNNCGFRLAANPAQSNLSIVFENPENTESIPEQIELYNEKQEKVLVKNPEKEKKEAKEDLKQAEKLETVVMDVSKLERGIYYLRLKNREKLGSEVVSVRILLN
jgi:hypothetical protein